MYVLGLVPAAMRVSSNERRIKMPCGSFRGAFRYRAARFLSRRRPMVFLYTIDRRLAFTYIDLGLHNICY